MGIRNYRIFSSINSLYGLHFVIVLLCVAKSAYAFRASAGHGILGFTASLRSLFISNSTVGRYRSGQTGLAVNQMSLTSGVRILSRQVR